ncbi:hypothetical protein Sste5346_002957 [Sporothrix stenoceras]|uniref:Alpha/beta hydrolase fold-3 domain-containing protein n=1 Tax=Sporothrix stenoceras TaxID=5173 RepID=A0ABR3ZGM0_9PEZI
MVDPIPSQTDMPSAIINPLHPSVEDKLDAKVKEIYNMYQANRLRADQVTYEEFNANRTKFIFPREKVASTPCAIGRISTHKIPVTEPAGEIDVRIYRSEGFEESDGKKLPLYVNYHGGGFVLGGLDDDDPMCRKICKETPCLIANVAYRMAPEFPHPVPVTDSWAALKWLVEHADELGIDRNLVAVGGLSAGGCLAAVLAQMVAKTNLIPLKMQVLIVPVTDARYVPLVAPKNEEEAAALDTPYKSYRDLAFAPMLPLERLVWFYRPWLGEDAETHAKNALDVRASPILAADEDLIGVARATFHVAEIDPLRSEAEMYYSRLKALGVPCDMNVYKGMVHPFAQWDGELPQARQLADNIANDLKIAFTTRDTAPGTSW